MKYRNLFIFLTITFVIAAGVMTSRQAEALPITIDEIIYEAGSGALDPLMLSVYANFTYSGNVLTIILTNTSDPTGALASESSLNLLTGIGFSLPDGMSIDTGGSHGISINTGSSAIGFTGPLDPEEWGYDNNPSSGGFMSLPELGNPNTVVSTLLASVDFDLLNGSNNVKGPAYGLLSKNVAPSVAGGQQAIQNSIILSLTLDGIYTSNLLSYIQGQNVVASFGSPDMAGDVVPEPTSILLLGSGLALISGIGLYRRKK